MTNTHPISNKIHEVMEEMKQTGIWKKDPPSWVSEFVETSSNDFGEWLQYIYLPNCLPAGAPRKSLPLPNYIAPQAIRYFGQDTTKGKLLQLLIELDAIS